jgi:hypothetical protein
LFGNGPHTSSQLTGDGHHDLVGVCAASHEFSIALTQAPLGLPADILDRCGWCFESQLQVSTHVGGILLSPSAFTKRPTSMRVTGFGERTRPASLATGIFGRHETQERHQLSGRIEAREVAEFGQRGDGHGELHAT